MTGSIQDIVQKLKGLIDQDEYFYVLLIIVVSIVSFGLGRVSVQELKEAPKNSIMIQEQSSLLATSTESISTQEQAPHSFVASKKGTKYHLPSCPGARQMSEKNKIYFASEAQAQAAGYTRAKNCKF